MHLPRLFALLVALACSRCRGSDFVTIGIKTFERPALLQFCVEQVRLAYPELPLVVADDSSRAVQERNAQTLAAATRAGGGERGEERDGGGASSGGGPITHLALAFDVGLSAGRNRIVERCTTPFVCLFDDSRFVTPQTHVLAMAAFLAESGAHLVGGAVAGRGNRYYAGEFRPLPPPHDDRGGEEVVAVAVDARQQQQPQQQQQQPQRQQLIGVCFREPDDERRRIATATPLARVGGAFETELVLNAFVANASALRASPWDEALKLGEHKAFFYDFRRRGYRAAIAPACVFESAPAELRRYSDDGWFRQRAFQGEHAFEVLREPGCLAENAKSREHHDGAETDGEEVR